MKFLRWSYAPQYSSPRQYFISRLRGDESYCSQSPEEVVERRSQRKWRKLRTGGNFPVSRRASASDSSVSDSGASHNSTNASAEARSRVIGRILSSHLPHVSMTAASPKWIQAVWRAVTIPSFPKIRLGSCEGSSTDEI